MPHRCCYCSSTTKIHIFPEQPDMRQKWLDNIPNLNILKLPKRPYLCHIHFCEISYSANGRKLRNAVPTIFNIKDYDTSTKLLYDSIIAIDHNYAILPRYRLPSPPPFEEIEIKVEPIEIDTQFEIVQTPIEIETPTSIETQNSIEIPISIETKTIEKETLIENNTQSLVSNLLPEDVLRFSSDVDPSIDYSPQMAKHAIKICKTEIDQLKMCNKLMAEKIQLLKNRILLFEDLLNNTPEVENIRKQSCDKVNAELLFCLFE